MLAFAAAHFAVLGLLAGQVIERLVYGYSGSLASGYHRIRIVLDVALETCRIAARYPLDRLFGRRRTTWTVMLGDQPPLTPPKLPINACSKATQPRQRSRRVPFLKDAEAHPDYPACIRSAEAASTRSGAARRLVASDRFACRQVIGHIEMVSQRWQRLVRPAL
jgi:hypothetical protein